MKHLCDLGEALAAICRLILVIAVVLIFCGVNPLRLFS